MKAHWNSSSVAHIIWDTQASVLEAPAKDGVRQKYLPCETCDRPQIVPMNVVAVRCGECEKKEEDEMYQQMADDGPYGRIQ
jgi:formate dehydrogenase maturation protein FdhE